MTAPKKALASVFGLEIENFVYIEPESCFEYKSVVFKNDIDWLSVWGKNKKQVEYNFDAEINAYAKQGWRVHSLNYGSSVHGGSGQVSVLFERLIQLNK